MQPGKPILKTKSSVTLETDSYVSDATSIRQFKQKVSFNIHKKIKIIQ